ncbi:MULTISPECIES: NUDIX domain-containing protein [unclassified Agromyces]|uniref:NUDIX domain-containing protein n=1 Tax=unclassified Agromyces TaxID=2639701 RepID=UPI00301525E4
MDVVLAAGAAITDRAGRVLLVRRGREPQRGRWSVPGGRVEPDEPLDAAAAREALEETGLDVAVGPELWTVHLATGDGRVFEIHGFAAAPVGGSLRAGDDADDVRWVDLRELRRLPLTIHLLDHLRRGGIVPPLERIDEHAIEVPIEPDLAWSALERVVEGIGGRRLASALGCEDTTASGPRPLEAWSSVPGFHVVSVERPERLALAGRHRYADYELVFRLDAVPGGTRLRAETRADFPGPLGAAYRMMLLRTPLHALATRRVLARVARAAAAARSARR